jgi:hypothetical protein
MDSDKNGQFDAMLQSYNLLATVHFPTRVQYQSSKTIDNIFIDIQKIKYYAQLLIAKDANIQLLNKHTLSEIT